MCTGTLIAPAVVLTAAHCLDADPDRALVALFPDGATEEDHEAVAYALHPGYRPTRLAANDIAVLALDAPITTVAPLAMATRSPRPKQRGTIVGFGQDRGDVGVKEVGSVRIRRCPKAFPRAGIAHGQLATSVCWRPRRRGQDTCHGDSGGPLLVDGAVAGVTSGGYPDCPGVLSWDTDVAQFVPWIESLL